MIGYILSGEDLSIKDAQTIGDYNFISDIDYGGKSSIVFSSEPNVSEDDFIVCKDGNDVLFVGVCDTCETDSGSGYSISMKQAEAYFDRRIFIGTEALLSTGIEDFIVSEITANWVNSGDAFLDKDYLTAVAATHTPVNAKVSTIGAAEDGVYNLKTFLGNAKERYSIFTRFEITSSSLTVHVYKDTSSEIGIDTTISDITEYNEEYSVDVMAKLMLKWLNTTTSVITTQNYYLLTDRTITTDPTDPDRASGTVKAKYMEAETAAEVSDAVSEEFSSNSYEHKVSFKLKKGSRLYPASDFYVGRKIIIKTKRGIKDTIITKSSESQDSYIDLECGKLKVTLIEKLKGAI